MQLVARSGRLLWYTAVVLSVMLLPRTGATSRVHPAQQEPSPYAIDLLGSTIDPSPGIDPVLLERPELVDTPLIAVLQLWEELSPLLHADLDSRNVELLEFLGGTTYLARIASVDVLVPLTDGGPVRWAGPLRLEDKITLDVAARAFHQETYDPETDRVRLLIEFFPQAATEEQGRALLALSASEPQAVASDLWLAEIASSRIDELAAVSQIKLVQQPPIELPATLSGTHLAGRQALGSSCASSGRPVHIAVIDTSIHSQHPDFAPARRRFYTATTGTAAGSHGTRVALVAARHASGARLGDYSATNFSLGLPKTAYQAIVKDCTDVSNHSYYLSFNYGTLAQRIDRLIRGDARHKGRRIPARPQVWAAGDSGRNYRNIFPDGIRVPYSGYYSIANPAKNIIAVGAIDKHDSHVSSYSSLGPTLDGRIKPDLVYIGTQQSHIRSGGQCVKATGIPKAQKLRVTRQSPHQYLCCTSAAAPAVSGTVASMIYKARSIGIDPNDILPSTYKAILIHAAEDLWATQPDPAFRCTNPDTGVPVSYGYGPDLATGFGQLKASRAIRTMGDKRLWKQSVVRRTGDLHKWQLTVPAGTTELRVVVAWDDMPGTVHTGLRLEESVSLVNDLDLELLSPAGDRFYPWTVYPPKQNGQGKFASTEIQDAVRQPDHRNNVELITVRDPMPGRWTATIRAHRLGTNYVQRYSLVATLPIRRIVSNSAVCRDVPGLCSGSSPCEVAPWICDSAASTLGVEIERFATLPQQNADSRGTALVATPVRGVPECHEPAFRTCPGWQLIVDPLPSGIGLRVINQDGATRVVGHGDRRGTTLGVLSVKPGERFFLLATDADHIPMALSSEFPISVERLP